MGPPSAAGGLVQPTLWIRAIFADRDLKMLYARLCVCRLCNTRARRDRLLTRDRRNGIGQRTVQFVVHAMQIPVNELYVERNAQSWIVVCDLGFKTR